MNGGWIKIFAAGKHTDMKGRTRDYSAADLDKIVQAYNPKNRKAPLVLGHPKSNDPAYGWVAALKREGDELFMQSEQVVPEFAKMVNEGRFKYRSIAVHPETNELWHVGYLGAMQPAVAGLGEHTFAAEPAETAVFKFAYDAADNAVASLFQGLRDYLVEKEGLDKANQILPQWTLDFLKQDAVMDDDDEPSAGYAAAPAPAPAAVEPSAREKELELQLADAKKQLDAQAADKRRSEHMAFCQQLITDGRLKPAAREEALAMLELASQSPEMVFGAADAAGTAPKKAPLEIIKGLLLKADKNPLLSEFATGGAVPSEDAATMAQQASAYMAEQAKLGITVTAAEAVKHVKTNQGAVK